MAKQRIPPPPKPSLPKEAPWREIEEIIAGLKAVAGKLDALISLYTGVPVGVPAPPTVVFPPAPPAFPPVISVDGKLDALVKFTHMPLEWGTATGGSKDKLRCDGKAWADDIWAGYELAFVEGTGISQVRRIKTNDRTSLTPQSDFDIPPDRTTVFVIRTNRAAMVNKPAWDHNQKDVTAAGTAEQLSSLEVPDGCQLTVIAKPGNTGTIYLGKSKTDCENSAKRLDGLSAGLAASFKVSNANLVWIDAATSGEGVSWFVEQVS